MGASSSWVRVAAVLAAILFPAWLAAGTLPPAHVTIASFRLTDNSDNDGFADPRETVNLYLTLRNGSGSERTGVIVAITSNDPHVGCISTPVASFGTLAAGEVREASVPLTFQVADVNRTSPTDDLSATLNVTITGDDFQANPQKVTVNLDLNASGGIVPSSFSEGFEGTGFGTFTSMALDAGKVGPNANSEGLRCQYNDPDFVNSNSYGNTSCFLNDTGFDWHVHGISAPDGGRAYLGNNSLHWGMHVSGSPAADTTRLRQLEAVRTTNPLNLGWNGVTSELRFKHQIGMLNCDPDHEVSNCTPGYAADRAVVQIQVASSSGVATGSWRTISPYENVYDLPVGDMFPNCSFDPTDDGNDEDDYFEPNDPGRRLGPSSTCGPEFTFSRQGAIFYTDVFDPADTHHASDGPGLQGVRGPGTWVQPRFDLSRWRGHRVRFRFLVSTIGIYDFDEVGTYNEELDDGWYIDDIQVTNTLIAAATLRVDTTDRSGLPDSVWYGDADQDGYGNPADRLVVCGVPAPAGYVQNATDCNDGDASIHPGASDATCNGVDENCSGLADEGFVPHSTTCGAGVCASTGTTSCVAGELGDSCTPGPPASPTDATCNAVDENCSGTADEDYAPQGTICGQGVCAASGTTSCVAGVVQDSCVPGPPASPTDATCDGVDENCSGAADEGYVAQSTVCGVGVCAASGTTSCVAGVVQDSCAPGPPGSATDTTCDGLDENCSGAADEGYVPQSTTCGAGVCTASGTTFCVAGVVQNSCTPGPPASTTDTTCNGSDEDCSGAADEDYVALTTTCGVGVCRSSGTTSCVAGVVQNSCVPRRPPGGPFGARCGPPN